MCQTNPSATNHHLITNGTACRRACTSKPCRDSCQSSKPDKQWRVVLTAPDGTTQTKWVKDRLQVGQSEDAVGRGVVDDYLSKKHLELSVDDEGRLVVEDLNSANGTYQRLEGQAHVQHGARLLVGSCILTLTYEPIANEVTNEHSS